MAVSNGTVAIELALKSLKIKAGDEVVVTSRTFLASASSVVLVGATPVFADVNLESGNVDAKTIAAVITPKTKAILCVHMGGWPCEMEEINALAKKNNLFVVEDCAQAHGARIDDRVGSLGAISAFSFCQDKIMTTGGEGGMICTDNEALWRACWVAKDHGKNPDKMKALPYTGLFNWIHDEFGTNARMTEMQAAIGRIQLKILPAWLERRRINADKLRDCLESISAVTTPQPPSNYYHSNYKFYAYLDFEKIKPEWSRDKIMLALRDKGVPCFSGSCSEIYLEECFKNSGFSPEKSLPNARDLGERSLMFLVHPTLSDATLSLWTDRLTKFFREISS